ncbi:MAG: hypothetical protein EBR02_00870 [Alphaproteobacteria bacterium]|nr:hypothetical protein [Alphaproteobacteria bacterium]
MSNESNVKFTTFGPNRGLSLKIGNFQFVDGACEVAANEATAAASILCRYHDVCYAHELEQKVAEYDTAQENRLAATGEFPPATKLDESAKPEPKPAKKPEPQARVEKVSEQQLYRIELPDAPTEGATPQEQTQQEQTPQDEAPPAESSPAPVAETQKPQGNGKKNSGKQTQQ